MTKKYQETNSKYKYRVLVCAGGGCVSADCHEVKDALLQSLKENDLEDQVLVSETGCIGTCNLGPVMVVMPEEVFYTRLKPKDIPEIVKSHLVEGNILVNKTYFDMGALKRVPYLNEISFFKKQVKIALRNCGLIDYSSIDEYIANDGYKAVLKVLQEMTQEEVTQEITKSGLRGRGGAGFPAGIKWEAGRKAPGDQKYLICNADEGDPGAFMDRSIIEGDPHTIIEGMMIGGYAIGANKGFCYIRAEYPIAVERLEYALKQAREAGILGKNVFGTDFAFDIEIRIGAGAFVCGEETALMASVEGKRGEPKQKPPFPFQKGLFQKPTIINNVETLANIPPIILNGSEWFNGFGTEKSKGTKVFALAGDIVNTGLVEVPMGMTLREIVYDLGGGVPKKKAFKAAQMGGPSGGCIVSDDLDTPVDFDSLAQLGAIMGSGGLIVMNENNCMVDVAKFFMEFVQDESCGKCVPCRAGTKAILEVLDRILEGNGQENDIELMEKLCENIKKTAICGLGQTAPNPVLSTLRYFRDEYEEHIQNKPCRAGGNTK
ncbi:NADH-ubiquinone oxidoreductase-F iron-sulfur binding region domain-containing protein [Dehalobacterium formicoaceticum]|uniref:NADH-ubiquinone oxidoreductase-F iron-sulfur binding region domain-containing protein n=1 Tax=Dehalobacterium formicoaceticum TaxID=51515 RepID=UPI003B833198